MFHAQGRYLVFKFRIYNTKYKLQNIILQSFLLYTSYKIVPDKNLLDFNSLILIMQESNIIK